MRGPLDTLAAMRTPERMCVDLIEQPEAVFAILGELAELWIGVGQVVLDVIPPFAGEYMARMGTWAPGKILTAQNDVSTLLSPAMYNEFVLPWDRKIVEHFPYSEFHLHSSEHHQVDDLSVTRTNSPAFLPQVFKECRGLAVQPIDHLEKAIQDKRQFRLLRHLATAPQADLEPL